MKKPNQKFGKWSESRPRKMSLNSSPTLMAIGLSLTVATLPAQTIVFDTDFDEVDLASITGLSVDTPAAGAGNTNDGSGTVTLNTTNQALDLFATDANLWTTRDGAPIAWVDAPTVVEGQTWYVETRVAMDDSTGNNSTFNQAGITFYGGPDGANPGDTVNFALLLNDWGTWGVQQASFTVGDAANVTNVDLDVADSNIFFRAEITKGSASDIYNFFYKLAETDPWIQLLGVAENREGTFDNSRVALVHKTNNNNVAGETASFEFLTVGVLPPPNDADGDGLTDFFETTNAAAGYDPNVDDSATDFDMDNLTVAEELAEGTNVLLADTDGDTLNDGAEVNGSPTSDPLVVDTDGDGLTDAEEVLGSPSSNPNLVDTDGDELDDLFEVNNLAAGYDPNVDDSLSDFDDDASTVAEELADGTDVLNPDTDGDGFWDGAETNFPPFDFVSYDFSTNRGDTGTDPLLPDTDMDGLLDGEEPAFGADPNIADTDGDGADDAFEVQFGTDPNDDQDFPDVTILAPSVDATYFEVSASDVRVNLDLVRVGGNDGTIEFVGLLIFDLDGIDVADLQSENLVLNFDLGVHDDTPGLDDLVVDYVGTFASDILGVNGANGADPNATTLATAPVVTNLYNGAPTVGPQTINATPIGSDSFTERYAVFRLTDPNVAAHQWDITDTSTANANRLAATLVIGGTLPPVESDLVLCIEDDTAMVGNLLLSWNSEDGATYDLRSSADLTGDPASWSIVVPNIAADASGTTSESITPVTKTFYVVTEQ